MAGKSKLSRCSGAGEKRSKRARCSGAGEDQDRLSSLTDKILTDNILSRLPMLEAQRTGILARRWRYLWRYVPCLDLDGTQKLVRFHPDHTIITGAFSLDEPASDYAKWVDQTIDAHTCAALRNFRVRFHLGATSATNIDSWLAFSLKRGVEVLELDCCCRDGFPRYQFLPAEPNLYPNLRLLKSLTLKAIKLPYRHHHHLSSLLSACEFLEVLHLSHVTNLTKLKVKGPAVSRLKHVVIDCCSPLESFAIRAPTPDLVSFRNPLIYGEATARIKHAPRLVDIGVHPFNRDGTLHRLCRYLSQLEALQLFFFYYDMEHIDQLHHFPVLCRLKHLELQFQWSPACKFLRQKLRCLQSLVQITPSLQHLTLMVRHLGRPLALLEQLVKMGLRLPVPVIQISGFDGRKKDCELALLLVKHACPSLVKLIIDHREPLRR